MHPCPSSCKIKVMLKSSWNNKTEDFPDCVHVRASSSTKVCRNLWTSSGSFPALDSLVFSSGKKEHQRIEKDMRERGITVFLYLRWWLQRFHWFYPQQLMCTFFAYLILAAAINLFQLIRYDKDTQLHFLLIYPLQVIKFTHTLYIQNTV